MLKRLVLGFTVFGFVFSMMMLNVSAEYQQDGYLYTVTDDKATITDVSKTIGGETVIPSQLGGYDVVNIESEAFSKCETLTKVTLPVNLNSLGKGAFLGCSNLEAFSISENNGVFKTIDGVIFSKDATELILFPYGKSGEYCVPNETVCIGSSAFYNAFKLESVIIADSVIEIGNKAFYNNTILSNIKMSKNIMHIGTDAFFNTAYYNDEANIADGVLYIDNALIKVVKNIDGILEIKEGTTVIADRAAYRAFWWDGFILPEGLKSIGCEAFYNCTSLYDIDIPNSVEKIYDNAFIYSGLKTITIGENITYIGTNVFQYTGFYNNDDNWDIGELYIGNYLIKANSDIVGTYTIRDGTKVVAKGAFSNCYSVKEVVIPSTLTRIEDNLFSNRNLTNVTIKDGVKSIGKEAFLSVKLQSITIPSSVEEIEEYAIGYNQDYSKGYVPIEGFTIYGTTGTVAEEYAKINGFSFIDIDATLKGDVNADGSINATDFMQVRRHFLGLYTIPEEHIAVADVNGDGNINATDFMQIRRHFLGLFEIA